MNPYRFGYYFNPAKKKSSKKTPAKLAKKLPATKKITKKIPPKKIPTKKVSSKKIPVKKIPAKIVRKPISQRPKVPTPTHFISPKPREVFPSPSQPKASRALKKTVQPKDDPSFPRIVNFLAEQQLYRETTGKVLSLNAYAKTHQLGYQTLLKAFHKYKDTASKAIAKEYRRLKATATEPQYREHIVKYLVQKELELEDRLLTKQKYCQEQGLHYPTFLKYFRRYEYEVKDEAFSKTREAKEERLRALRASPPTPSRGTRLEDVFSADIKILDKLAKKKLPTRKGRVMFSDDAREQLRAEGVWLDISDDVRMIGLSNLVAQKWAQEPTLRLPPNFPEEIRNRLILTKIETVLQQLDLFVPFTGAPTFKQLHDWAHPKPKPTPKVPQILDRLLPGAEVPELVPVGPEPVAIPDGAYDEEWLKKEIEKEEQEGHRYEDTPEERAKRRDSSSIIPRQIAVTLDKNQIDELKNIGALYDDGDWLVPVNEDLSKYLVVRTSQPTIAHKPKLLVGIGANDYIKDWMREAFDIRTVADPNSLRHSLVSFRPDSMMIYKSSAGRNLWHAMVHYAAEASIPLIVFDRGFSDAVMSAQSQNVSWFINAYRQRKAHERRLMRRRNPIFSWMHPLIRNPRRHLTWR